MLFIITYAFSVHLLGYSLIWHTTMGSLLFQFPGSPQKSQVMYIVDGNHITDDIIQ